MSWGAHSHRAWPSAFHRACFWGQRAYFRLRAEADSRFFRHAIPCERSGLPLVTVGHCQDKRFFVTTILRNSQDNHMTGFLYELDWQGQRVLRQVPLALADGTRFWNPRGANRGGRGMAVLDGELLVGVAQRILRFDRDLKYLGAIENPNLGSVHGLAVHKGTIWATSGLHDMVVNLDREGNTLRLWHGHESRALQHKFFLPRRSLNLSLEFPDDQFMDHYLRYAAAELYHINALALDEEDLLVLLPRIRSVLRLKENGGQFDEQMEFTDPCLPLAHDLVLWEGRYLVNDTHNQHVRLYGKTGKLLKVIETRMVATEGQSRQFFTGGWQRGLTHLHGSTFLVATSPAMIFELDIEHARMGRVLRLDQDVNNCPSNIFVTSEL